MKDSDVVVMERFRGRTLRAAVAYLLATVVAWFSPITGFYLYIAVAPHKFFSPAAPATMPLRLIKARI